MSAPIAPRRKRGNILPPLQFIMTGPQETIFNDPARNRVVVAGRRFGKTYLGKYEVSKYAVRKANSYIWFIAPSRGMGKRLLWKPLKEFLPRAYIKDKNETDLSIELLNGSTITVKSADNPDSLRGDPLDFVVFDEARDQAAYTWEVIRPSLADKQGDALFITTPNGFDWVYDLKNKHEGDPSWGYHHYTTEDGGNVPKEEIEAARRDMDPRMFEQEFNASFVNMAGRVYYAFDRDKNVVDLSESVLMAQDGKTTVLIGEDFNISPGAVVVGIRRGRDLHIIDDIEIPDSNTELMAKEIRRRYPDNPVYCFPDPAGGSRHTSAAAGTTDFTLLRKAGFQVYDPGTKYHVVDRINTVNAALCSAAGERRLLFHKGGSTQHIKKSLDGFTYVEGTRIPDPKSPLGHIGDALGYLAMAQLPLKSGMGRIPVTGA